MFMQVLHTIALLVKRASLDKDRGAVFDSIFSAITQLLAMDLSKMVQWSFFIVAPLTKGKPIWASNQVLNKQF